MHANLKILQLFIAAPLIYACKTTSKTFVQTSLTTCTGQKLICKTHILTRQNNYTKHAVLSTMQNSIYK